MSPIDPPASTITLTLDPRGAFITRIDLTCFSAPRRQKAKYENTKQYPQRKVSPVLPLYIDFDFHGLLACPVRGMSVKSSAALAETHSQ